MSTAGSSSTQQLAATLVSNWTERRIVELNRAGQVIWQVKTTKHPWANCGLPNGHRVVCFYNGKVIVGYDSRGSVRWTTHLPDHPTSVERMRPLVAAGNSGISGDRPASSFGFLVACGRQLLELNARGRIVRKIALPSMAYHAHPLSNGNFLVALGQLGKVVEISPGGRITWELAGLLRPGVAQPLPNGNVLVCELGAGRAVEYDREKRVVWSRAGLPNLIGCQRLSNGLTMLVTQNSVRLVDPAGVTRWQKRFSGFLYASRY